MRYLLSSLLAFGLLAGDALAQGDGGGRRSRRRDRDVASVVLTHFTFQRVEFETKDLTSGKARYGVYLPEGYADPANAERKYPLVIWLHGMREDEQDFHFGGAKAMDDAVAERKLAPFVFVTAVIPSRTLYMNGEREGNMADLVTKDLVADVEKRFRVSPERADRALMGISLGGMAALRFAFNDPSRFGTVATHSAALFPEDPTTLPAQHRATFDRFGEAAGWFELLGNPIDLAKYQAFNPTVVAHGLKDVKGLRIYFDAGTEDRYGFEPANRHLSEILKEKGIAHTFRSIEGGQHSWSGGTVQKALVESLAFVTEGFTKSAAPPPAPAKDAAPAAEKKGGDVR